MPVTNEGRTLHVTTSQQFQAQAAKQPDRMLESEIADRQRHEPDFLAYAAVKYSARRMIPYGRWTCADGREVIFNREYQPMFSRFDGVDTFCDRAEVVKDIEQAEYFYGDHNSPVSYLVRKFRGNALDKTDAKECRNSLMVCLKMLREYEPKPSEEFRTTWRSFGREMGIDLN